MKNFLKKIIPYFFVPIFIIGIEVLIFNNSNNGILTKVLKLYNSHMTYDVCFYGDSKNQWNFNYNTLKKEFPSLTFYNFSLGGFSFDDIYKFYGNKTCNCKINIVNLHELTQDDNVISKKYGYLFSNLISFNFLNPLNFHSILSELYYENQYNRKIENGFFNIENKSPFFSDKNNLNDFPIEKIKSYTEEKYQRFNLKFGNKSLLFIIHPDRDFRKSYLYKNLGKEYLINLHKTFFKEHQLIDFREIKSLTEDSVFFDTHHLNKRGSILLTKIFSDSLRNSTPFKSVFKY